MLRLICLFVRNVCLLQPLWWRCFNIKSFEEVISVTSDITTTYDLEKHVWEESIGNGEKSLRNKTLSEFLLRPSLSFLSDILQNMHSNSPSAQAYWVQAEYGAGKSHLLAVLVQLALAGPRQWRMVREKEDQEGISDEVSLLRNIDTAVRNENMREREKGIFPIVCNLVGRVSSGFGSLGRNCLLDCITNVTANEYRERTGSSLLLYPAEKLVERFVNEDKMRYSEEFAEFLSTFDIEEGLQLSNTKGMSAGDLQKVARVIYSFYHDWLKVEPRMAIDKRSILKNMIETIMQEGYRGVLIVLDEVGQFLQTSSDVADDEDTLLVLSQFLPHIAVLPVWTVAATQNDTVSEATLRKLLAENRFQFVEVSKDSRTYSSVVASRIRTIHDEQNVLGLKSELDKRIRWSKHVSDEEFLSFYPFHPECFGVVRHMSSRLMGMRSTLSIMYSVLRKAVNTHDVYELICLDVVLDELLSSIPVFRAHFDLECRSYDNAFLTLQNTTSRLLRRNMAYAMKILKILFMYCVAGYKMRATIQDIVDAVMIPHEEDSFFEETCEFYAILLDAMQIELVQIARDSNGYYFSFTVPESQPIERFEEFRKHVGEEEILGAWNMLLKPGEWRIDTADGVRDFSCGLSLPFSLPAEEDYRLISVEWRGREVRGRVTIKDLSIDQYSIPLVRTDKTDEEFLCILCVKPMDLEHARAVLHGADPRVILWVPGDVDETEKEILTDFAAYMRMLREAGGLSEETAWVYRRLKEDLPRTLHVLSSCYSRGRIQSRGVDDISFAVVGELQTILAPAVTKVLDNCYGRNVTFLEQGANFSNRDCMKIINGFVKHGKILAQDASRDKSITERFAVPLGLASKDAPRELNTSSNVYCNEILRNISGKRVSSREIYSMFTGVPYGLTRRMIQMYLIALVQSGYARVELSGRQDCSCVLNAENVSSIDFTARILNSIAFVELDDTMEISVSCDSKLCVKGSIELKDAAEVSVFIKALEDRLSTALNKANVTLQLEFNVIEK